MTFHFVRLLTQIDLKSREVNSLSSNDVSSVSDNPSQSRNISDSSNSQNNIAVKSKRNRAYLDKDDNRRIASLANRRHLTSTRSDVEQNTERTKSSSLSDLHSFSQRDSADETSRKDDATDKSNEKKRRLDVVDVENAFLFESRQQNLSASNKSELWQNVSFRVKNESSWRTYDEDYDLRVDELVIVTKKKRSSSKMTESDSASTVIAIRKLSDSSRNVNLFTLLRIQEKYFVKCIETYEFEADLYVILEHMPIFLVQVVAAFVHSRETHVTAIVEQVGFQPVSSKRRHWRVQMLSAIKFLEFENLIHDNISCSSVLLNDNDQVKISMQKRCTIMLKQIERRHSNVQTLEDVMMQLLKKRKRDEANDLRRWFFTVEEFLSKTTSAFAEELLQVSKFDSLQMTIILTFEACFSWWLKEEWSRLVDINHSSLIAQILYDELISHNFSAFSVIHQLSM